MQVKRCPSSKYAKTFDDYFDCYFWLCNEPKFRAVFFAPPSPKDGNGNTDSNVDKEEPTKALSFKGHCAKNPVQHFKRPLGQDKTKAATQLKSTKDSICQTWQKK